MGSWELEWGDHPARCSSKGEEDAHMFNHKKVVMGFGASNRKPEDDLTPAEKKLLERVAERLIEEHSETLKKLGNE